MGIFVAYVAGSLAVSILVGRCIEFGMGNQ